MTALLSNLYQLRELRLAHCTGISDSAFTNLPPKLNFDYLRILDLTGCEEVRDDAICRIVPATPKLRNLVLAKCRHLTDRAVAAICRLGKNLHYIHLGHCINLTDSAVIALVKACNRIRYIDLACCNRLTDQSVQHLAQLPKLRRIGLVKCQQLTDQSILALAGGGMSNGIAHSRPGCLERVHLSYCLNLTLQVSHEICSAEGPILIEKQGIHELLQYCPRLTHLSLTGVQAFLREDLTRFCRDAPAEFTHPQRDVFCVFSGEGVSRLREYLTRLAEDQERERRISREASAVYSEAEAGSSRETISDDGTIDAGDEGQQRRPTLLPRPAGHRSYADVVTGSGSNSPDREDGPAGDEQNVPLLGARNGRAESRFRRRSSRAGSFGEGDTGSRLRGYLDTPSIREASRSISEGQVPSSRPRFAHSDVATPDDYFPAMAEAQQPRRPLPPRPHWPPQAQSAQLFDGEQQIPVASWGNSRPGASSRPIGVPRVSGRSGVHDGEDSSRNVAYDSDGDEEMTVRQSARRYRDTDGEMEA